jgi:hypothetical protein
VLAILKSWLGEGLAPPCQIPGFEIQLSAVIFPIQQFQPTSAASLNDVNCHTSQLVNNAERIVTGMTLQMSYYGVHLLQMSYYGVHLLQMSYYGVHLLQMSYNVVHLLQMS